VTGDRRPPVSHYQDLDGYCLPTVGEMIWHYPDGDLTYGKVEVKEIAYNIGALH